MFCGQRLEMGEDSGLVFRNCSIRGKKETKEK